MVRVELQAMKGKGKLVMEVGRNERKEVMLGRNVQELCVSDKR